MVEWIERGNIFSLNGISNYAHGCNCAGAMGKGIALQFKMKFPIMYREYKKLCTEGGFSLGSVFEYDYGNGYIFNLGTQKSWRAKADIEAIHNSLEKMLEFALNHKLDKIALPRIGAGLGGLEWENVKSVIKEVGEGYPNITLYVVENYSPDVLSP